MPIQYTDEQIRQYLEMSAHFRDVASERGITSTQLELILYLGVHGIDRSNNGLNVGTIVTETHMGGSNVSQNLSKLWIQYHLVDKTIDIKNQRERRVKLNVKGERVYESVKAVPKER